MTPASKMDFKRIQDAIRMLGRDDVRTRLQTKVGDNPAAVAAVLTQIEELCAVIRQQEGLGTVETWTSASGTYRRVCRDDVRGSHRPGETFELQYVD